MNTPISIIGAGIGGLAVAIALQKRGYPVIVYEAAAELQPVGSGITMPPNALAVLDELGVAAAVQRRGMQITCAEVWDVQHGRLQTLDTSVQTRTGRLTLTAIHRAELHAALVEALAAGTLQLGKALVRVEQNADAVQAHFGDGSSAEASILISADGLRSAVRHQLWPAAQLRYSGQGSYRGIARMALPAALAPIAREYWAPGCRFGFVAISPDTTYWYATIEAAAGQLRQQDPSDTLQRAFGDFPEPIAALLAATPGEQLVCTDIYDLQRLDRWDNGRIILLGDAAHACTPNLGQGGAQAIEDAAVLADALAGASSYREAFQHYQAQRRRRTQLITGQSRMLGRAAHLAHPWARAARNAAMRHMPARMARNQAAFLYGAGSPTFGTDTSSATSDV
ncbi:MAG TPA: FAD-dependent monooxygenase [Roseiflexaceae bacterium]|nr:FAD-dependent monooxygenase [Roseiflexaceae bacterium]